MSTAKQQRQTIYNWCKERQEIFDLYTKNFLQQWKNRPLETIVLNTCGNYKAVENFTTLTNLPKTIVIDNHLVYTANLVEKKDDEYMQLLFTRPAGCKQAVTDPLLTYLPVLLDKARSNDSLLLYWCHGLRRQFRQAGPDELEEMIDTRYLSETCKAGDDKDLQNRLKAYTNTRKGRLAPAVTSYDFDLYLSFKTDSTLIVFWATWCSHCQQELPELEQYPKYHPGVKVVAIALDTDAAIWKQYITKWPAWHHIRALKQWTMKRLLLMALLAPPLFL